MTERFQNLARRFGNARPGLQLVAVEDAAIPVTMLRVDVLAQERQPLPITEEFVLRFVSQGVDDPTVLASYLGLDHAHVIDAAAAQITEGSLQRTLTGNLRLTALGTAAARDLLSVQPVDRPLPLPFDRLTWRIADYTESDLVEKKEAEEAGWRMLPAEKHARLGAEDVPVNDFNALLRSDSFQILRVRNVTTTKHRYLPVQLLVYADVATGELDLAICIEDRLAVDHSIALAKLEAVERLQLRFEPVDRPVLEPELEEQRNHTNGPSQANADHRTVDDAPSMSTLVRSVSVFEHPDLLADALGQASKRLLIVSPWVRRAVVTTDFIATLEKRLRAGVSVTIAHGYGDDDSGSAQDALRRFRNLAKRYDKLTFARLRSTHAKILIYDDNWVSTSFNWLSFKGDRERTYRMEEGTLVQIPSRVEAEYQRYLATIEEQRVPE